MEQTLLILGKDDDAHSTANIVQVISNHFLIFPCKVHPSSNLSLLQCIVCCIFTRIDWCSHEASSNFTVLTGVAFGYWDLVANSIIGLILGSGIWSPVAPIDLVANSIIGLLLGVGIRLPIVLYGIAFGSCDTVTNSTNRFGHQ
jgi:hypothetical protein